MAQTGMHNSNAYVNQGFCLSTDMHLFNIFVCPLHNRMMQGLGKIEFRAGWDGEE